jgi:hypothetical protein
VFCFPVFFDRERFGIPGEEKTGNVVIIYRKEFTSFSGENITKIIDLASKLLYVFPTNLTFWRHD